jgi:hypothetical protein
MGQVLQGGDQRPNRMAHRSSFAARCSADRNPLKTRARRECAELFSTFPLSTATATASAVLFLIETPFLRASSTSKRAALYKTQGLESTFPLKATAPARARCWG